MTLSLAHRLLWVIGIAHGDVSFHNIMIKLRTMVGVLNDWDLAAIMEPGATSPPKIGFRRTGVPLFMAVELLRDEAIPRLYRHDLEAFAWVLLYASICVQGGKENLDVEPIRNWALLGPSQLEREKLLFLLRSKNTVKGLHNETWLCPIFKIWYDIHIVLASGGDILDPPNDAQLLGDVLSALEIARDDWVDFTLAFQL